MLAQKLIFKILTWWHVVHKSHQCVLPSLKSTANPLHPRLPKNLFFFVLSLVFLFTPEYFVFD